MTDTALDAVVELGPLPELVEVTSAFIARMPTQRILDLLGRLEAGATFGELMQSMPSRMLAFRALLRDFPERDPTSLWLAAYDTEVGVVDEDPTEGKSPTPSPLSAPFTA